MKRERRCGASCPYFISTRKTFPEYDGIGLCEKTGRLIKDTLCGCRMEDGKMVLLNFGEGGNGHV